MDIDREIEKGSERELWKEKRQKYRTRDKERVRWNKS